MAYGAYDSKEILGAGTSSNVSMLIEELKGYLAFALWNFIPAPGGEKYKSILMQGLGNDH